MCRTKRMEFGVSVKMQSSACRGRILNPSQLSPCIIALTPNIQRDLSGIDTSRVGLKT